MWSEGIQSARLITNYSESENKMKIAFRALGVFLVAWLLMKKQKPTQSAEEDEPLDGVAIALVKKPKRPRWIAGILLLLVIGILLFMAAYQPTHSQSQKSSHVAATQQPKAKKPFSGGTLASYCDQSGQRLSLEMREKKSQTLHFSPSNLKDKAFECTITLNALMGVLAPQSGRYGDYAMLAVQRGFTPEGKPYFEVIDSWHQLVTERNPGEQVVVVCLAWTYVQELKRQHHKSFSAPVAAKLQQVDPNAVYDAK